LENSDGENDIEIVEERAGAQEDGAEAPQETSLDVSNLYPPGLQ